MEENQDQQAMWDEVAAERAADPDKKPVAKPVETPKAKEPEAVKPEVATPEAAKPTIEEQLAQALSANSKLADRLRNVEGHIGGLTSQQRMMQETMAAARNAAAEVKDAPTPAQVKAAIANPEQWEKLKGDFPEWSDATEKFIDAKLSGIKSGADVATVEQLVSKAIATAKQTITQEVEQKIVDKSLNAVFPGWRKEQSEIQAWVQTQSDEVKAWADSDDVGDAARVLSLWSKHKESNPAQQIQAVRKQKLEAAVAAPRGSKPVREKSWDDMTPDERWNYEARQRARERA